MRKPYSYQILPKTTGEIESAFEYYNQISPPLGENLMAEVKDTISIACQFPLSRSYYWYKFRAILLPTFPYFLIYSIKKEELIFYAFFPARENPEKLKRRLNIKS
jgi:hypothetical protein